MNHTQTTRIKPRTQRLNDNPDPPADNGHESVTHRLLDFGRGGELFHDGSSNAYATVTVNRHDQTHRIHGTSYREWLTQRYLAKYGQAPHRAALLTALDTLAAIARSDGLQQDVYLRVARVDDRIYLDMGTPDRRVIEVAPGGWTVLPKSPVRFLRSPKCQSLPKPTSGGSIHEMWELINVRDEADRIAVIAWLLGALGGRGPFLALLLYGEQGTAKSSGCRQLRSLVDPSHAPLALMPEDARSLWVSVANNYAPCLENVSHISAE